MEEVNSFKYLGAMICKHGKMEGEVQERTLQGRKVIGELGRVLRGGMVSHEVKKSLRDSVLLPTITYGSETWSMREGEMSKIRAVEMSFLRAASGISIIERVSNERIYENFGMSEKKEGIKCGVVEWMKRNTLRWYGHVRRMEEDRLVKRVYDSEVAGRVGRGRPLVTWDNRVDQYVGERVGNGRGTIERAKEKCGDKVAWRLFCHGHPLSGSSQEGARRQRY